MIRSLPLGDSASFLLESILRRAAKLNKEIKQEMESDSLNRMVVSV